MKAAAFMRNVPVLAGLSDELLGQIAAQVNEVHVGAGDWVMREGDAADSMFIVRSGRVEVIDEGPPEALIRILRRGDVLGELALLRQGTRSASVRARRDTDLLELGRTEFEALIQTAPSFALGLTRALGGQLAQSRSPIVAASPPRTIAIVGLDGGAPIGEVADEMTAALSKLGSVACIADAELSMIDQAERDADRVVLRTCAGPDEPWTALCVREADLVLAVTTGSPEPQWLAHATALQGCELLVLGPPASDAVLEQLQPREVQVVRAPAGRVAALEQVARRISGRALGIVLSGGGARALAHLGVLEVLRDAGLRFDRIGGVSLGALVAGAAAAAFTARDMYEAFEHAFVEANPSNDFVPPAYSLIRGGKTRRLLRDAFGELRIEELPVRFFCLSCDLIARDVVVHRTGPVIDAIYASLALPGIFPPVASEGRLLVDGGVLDNLPVATMSRTGEGPVIAVDVTGRTGQFGRPARGVPERLSRPVRRALTGGGSQIPRLGETIVRTLTVGSIDTVVAARLHADLMIGPRVDGIGLMDWRAFGRAVELGREAAREALVANPDLTERLGL